MLEAVVKQEIDFYNLPMIPFMLYHISIVSSTDGG